MLKNWISTFYRSSIRHRGFTLLNLAGLTAGIAAALLALTFIQHELSYDRFHKDAKRIFTAALHIRIGDSDFWTTGVPAAMDGAIRESIPGVASTGLKTDGPLTLRKDTELISFKDGYVVSGDFFKVFTFPLREGSEQAFYDNPNSIVLSAHMADMLFGKESAVGQTVQSTLTGQTFAVAGVLQPIPTTSSLEIDYLLPKQAADNANGWRGLGTRLFFKVPPGSDIPKTQETLSTLFLENSTLSKRLLPSDRLIQIYPITGLHLGQISGDGWVMDYSKLYGVGLLGAFILLLAMINYINLTTARGLTRAREVGMRKTLGANRSTLIFQFLAESLLTCALALIAALVLTELVLPQFSQLVQRKLSPGFLHEGWFIAASVGMIIVVGLLSGAAPAYFLSSYPSIEVMKGRLVSSHRGRIVRSILVVGQFIITVGLIGAMMTVQRQLHYMQQVDLGYNQKQICFLKIQEGGTSFSELKQRILSIPGVQAASLASSAPFCGNLAMAFNTDEESKTTKPYYNIEADEDLVKVYGLTVLKGHAPTAAEVASGAKLVLINERGVKDFNLGPDPLGKTIDKDDNFEIAGVVRDFLINSAQYEQLPIVFTPQEQTPNVLVMRLNPVNWNSTLNAIKAAWRDLMPGQPYEMHFLDTQVQQAYVSERNLSKMITVFTGVALLIAALGLYGLSLYTAVLRTKEIGIRKILGASSVSIAQKLALQHLVHVAIAIVIATPISYLLMKKWLEAFAFRIQLGSELFIVPALGSLLLGLLAVGSQAWRASIANPVDSLHEE